MRHPNQSQGKFFKFRNISEWDDDAKRDVRVPKIVRAHMVLVLGKSDNRQGFVKIVTVRFLYHVLELLSTNSDSNIPKVTSTQADNVDSDLLVPIAPSPKNRKTDMQLNVANVGFDWSYRLRHRLQKPSYLRVDKVWEVPSDVLEPFFWSQSEHVELKQKSYNRLMSFMRRRPEQMLNIPAE